MSNRPRPQQRKTAAKRAQQRKSKRNMIIVACVVVVVVAAAVVAAITSGGSPASKLTVPTGSAAAAIVAKVTTVPETVTDQVGGGLIKNLPTALTGQAQTADGKPSLLYIGAEFCPFCAGERWAIVNALSRFGTFTGLAFTHSSSTDVYPDTQTFTFRDAQYTSQYVAFTAVEVSTNEPTGNGGYKPLDTPTAEQQQIWASADPNQSFPFLDIGGKYLVSGASYDVGVIHGKSAAAIADLLADPKSDVARGVLAAANALTAAICATTANQPAAVCDAAGVKIVQPLLPPLSTSG